MTWGVDSILRAEAFTELSFRERMAGNWDCAKRWISFVNQNGRPVVHPIQGIKSVSRFSKTIQWTSVRYMHCD
jgi:hypothetical protein